MYTHTRSVGWSRLAEVTARAVVWHTIAVVFACSLGFGSLWTPWSRWFGLLRWCGLSRWPTFWLFCWLLRLLGLLLFRRLPPWPSLQLVHVLVLLCLCVAVSRDHDGTAGKCYSQLTCVSRWSPALTAMDAIAHIPLLAGAVVCSH